MSSYRIAVGPTNALTGERKGVWMDATEQVAFVWEGGLRFYADRLHDVTREEAVEAWKQKAANGE